MADPLLATTPAQAFALQFRWSHGLVAVNCDGLSHEDSLLQPEPSGNCLNWIVGHIVASRQLLLPVLGEEAAWPQERIDRYGRHSEPIVDGEDAAPFDELLQDHKRSLVAVLRGLPSLEGADLDVPAPFSTAGRDNETLGSLVAGFAFHEAYHAGQVSPLRRRTGRDAAFR